MGTQCVTVVVVLVVGGWVSQGLKPRAFYLKIWLEDELMHLGECPWEEDWAYASEVCRQAGVPLEAISLQKEYWDQVITRIG